jgi:hypothetical protein
LHSVLAHSLKVPGFNLRNLSSEKLVSKFAFKWVNLYHYVAVFGILMPLSLRGEVLGELSEDVRKDIVGRCGGAGLGRAVHV